MSTYNPKAAYESRKNSSQQKGDAKRDKHRDSVSQGGCSCNYTINTNNSKGR